jgi:hypothetical protein
MREMAAPLGAEPPHPTPPNAGIFSRMTPPELLVHPGISPGRRAR